MNPPNVSPWRHAGANVFDGQYLYMYAGNFDNPTFYFIDPTKEGFTIVRPEERTNGFWVPPRIVYPAGDVDDYGDDGLDCTTEVQEARPDNNEKQVCDRLWHQGKTFMTLLIASEQSLFRWNMETH